MPPEGIAHLSVASDPPGAYVLLDGSDDDVGQTPVEISVMSGDHEVRLSWPVPLDEYGNALEQADEVIEDLTIWPGHRYRFLAVQTSDDVTIEPDATARLVCDVVAGHRAAIEACHVPMDATTLLGVGIAYDGSVWVAQVTGEMDAAEAECAVAEMLRWRFVAAPGVDRYYDFAPTLEGACDADPDPD